MARKFYIEDEENRPAIVYELAAPNGYTEITDAVQLKALYSKKYKEREKDGYDYYSSFRSGLMYDIEQGTITGTEAFLLEAHVKDLKDEFLSGNWLTAQYVNTTLTLSGLYDQAMKDSIQADIDQYIIDNY